MTGKNRIAICTILFLLVLSLSACGAGGSDSQGSGGDSASQPAAAVEADTVEQAVQQADAFSSADKLIGSWTDIAAPDRFVNITQTDSGYQYEDNEGAYPATFADGKLTVKLSDTDSAEAYVDTKSGHLFSVYQENISEYQQK